MKAETGNLFRKLEAIGELTEEMKAAIDAMPLQVKSLAKGEHVVSDGEISRHSCLLLEGMLHRSKLTPQGNRQILSIHIPGDVPDLHSYHLKKMDHDLVATVDCQVALIAHEDIGQAIHASPALSDLLWRETLIDAATFRAWMTMIGQTQTLARVAHILCELYVRWEMIGDLEGGPFPFPLSQDEVADVIGASIVLASHSLQALQQRGLVSLEGGKATVLDWPALRDLAQFEPAYLYYLHETRRR
ncbi:Crp/Fnr family transcriptional regulator [Devosia sp. 919]|uniref:Crp/Fnr family transcriptional regulator n=1 Tax=Devosia sp. 919 TaxID=2726065 RepID=UPI0015519E2B|nr:Crp/Fnr family transcriptional regulator [Devosia sp. 919]